MPSVSRIDEREALQVETLTTEPEFVALAEQWSAVAERVLRPSVFLTPEWFQAAWAWRRHDSRLHILTVRAHGVLVGILPLIRKQAANGIARQLVPLTVPDTQTFDLIVMPSHRAAAYAAFASALAQAHDWDVLEFNYAAPDGELITGLLPECARLRLRAYVGEASRNAFIALADGWDAFYATRTRKLKKANNLATNRLRNAGVVRIERLGPGAGDTSSLAPMLDAVIDVSRRSWKKTTGNSLDQPGPGDFIRCLSTSAHARGWLSLWLAYLDDRPVAMEYQLVFAGNVHALRADFDASCSEISPGSYLFRHLLEDLFGMGLARYYMGPGQNPYKARWTDQGEPGAIVSIYHRTVRGRLCWNWERNAKPRLRLVRDRFAVKRDPVTTTSNNADSTTT